jgi:hypothetical protein
MTAIIILLLILVLIASGVLVAVFAMQQDKRQALQRDHKSLQEQHRALQEQYRLLQERWEERFRQARQRFGTVMDLDEEADRVRAVIDQLRIDHQRERDVLAAQRSAAVNEYNALVANYQAAKAVYDRLKQDVSLLEENLEDISFGLYKPHFNFDTSEAFRKELERVRESKKQMVRNDQATRCLVEWSVGQSRAEGVRMQKQLTKLMLRAFNGETDAAVGNCRWNNVTRMEERVRRAFTAINQLGTVIQVSIVPEYLDLALNEVRLEFEYQEKRRAEAEEQREIRERMREEERVQREAERAQAEAAAEEARYGRALAKARDEIKTATGEKLAELVVRIRELESELAVAHANHERAVSMAQLTRCGYVYIISNIGSFGENMFKLGLTRRLEPMERVRELGDASVPFAFDVHAMVYSEDAPALECALHQHFRERSVNLVNFRKEFFHVSLDEIEQFLTQRGLGVQLTKLAEAREYRETLTLRAKATTAKGSERREAFPPALPSPIVAEARA